MSSTASTPADFVQACLQGMALLPEVEDWVETWHEAGGRPNGRKTSLGQHLGMTDDEYALWAERPEALRFIVAAHRSHVDVVTLLEGHDDRAVAARTDHPDEAAGVVAWLHATRRL